MKLYLEDESADEKLVLINRAIKETHREISDKQADLTELLKQRDRLVSELVEL